MGYLLTKDRSYFRVTNILDKAALHGYNNIIYETAKDQDL